MQRKRDFIFSDLRSRVYLHDLSLLTWPHDIFDQIQNYWYILLHTKAFLLKQARDASICLFCRKL